MPWPAIANQTSEVLRLMRELQRVTEERNILKITTTSCARDAKGSTHSSPSIAYYWYAVDQRVRTPAQRQSRARLENAARGG